MKIKSFSLVIFLFFCWTNVWAADAPPVAIMKNTASQLIAALEKNKAQIRSNPKIVDNVVRTILLPQVDIESMSRSVVGRPYWGQATPAQRNEFKKMFVRLVINTYSTPLSTYTNEKIRFYPLRKFSPTDLRVQVNSEIIRPNGPPIAVDYRLIRSGNSWKVYDFSVEGISMVQSFNSQFANALQQGGLANLLQQLQNRQRNG